MTIRVWLRIIAWIFIISGFFYLRATKAGNEIQSKKSQQVVQAFNSCISTQLEFVEMLQSQYLQREVYLGILDFCRKNTGYEGK